ncbi:ABC transporter permease subunit [Ornithinimicrobium cerasi]|uniref:Amino acid/amide ABC transporter membrane protein 2, HAAT family /amino acid/amide ABC transporter ATP-binding protein 1, HAAT family n=1 Tax=Ornithinimicrobium cerasi TaxID=2248773 RepID=A0A285VSP6_9MICO|nr:branched-chain amino acid ABC transporter ATP-binding protein/permease [Ornithinimicrobium cerasi]SOC56897.1 amino acid/amide ABC transporter membrane protein 2, HAAT family /amino acid/amide ABC transporter ATP-binding protein 1, HAAT family [Ornithinimicrobium cerasi]
MPRLRTLLPYLLLVVGLVLFPLVASTNLVNIGVYVLIFTVAAVGLSLLMGLAGQVSLGQAAFFAVGAYTQAILVTKHGWSMLLALPVAVAAAMLLALLVGVPLLRLRGHFLALATLGLGIIVTVVVRELDYTGGTSGIFGIPKPEFGGRVYNTPAEFFWLLAPVVVLSIALAQKLTHSRIGRALGAVNDSEVAAECLGVDTSGLRLRVFVLAAGYAGLAGVFYAHWLAVVSPEAANFPLSVSFLLMVVLGGLGTVWGALTGAILVETLDEGMRTLIPQLIPGASGEVQLLGFGVVLVLVIILVPGGLAQLWSALVRRFRGTRADPGVAEDAPAALGEELDDLLAQADVPERGSPILQVRGLTKRYGGVVALSEVDLDVHAGEIVALIGPNGAGKTTAFNIITGVMGPTEGSVTVRGQEVQGRRPHVVAALGATRTFQNLQVFRSSTVRGNVMVARHLRSRAGLVPGMLGLDLAEERRTRREADRVLTATGLAAHADRPITALSFGQQRQVEVARALALAPSLLLLDEPMAGLSSGERDHLGEMLRRVRGAGIAVLLVEHDVAAVMALADRIVVLDDGVRIAEGTPAEIRRDPAVIAAYLGSDEDDDAVVHTRPGPAREGDER